MQMNPNISIYKFLIILLVLAGMITVISCETYNQEEYEELVIVEAYAIANDRLPDVRIHTTTPAEDFFDPSETAITGANVQVVLLDESDQSEKVFDYFFSPAGNGIYIAGNRSHRMQANRTYRLDIDFNDRPEVIRAYTTIPDQLTVLNEIADSVVYQSEEQLEIVIPQPQNNAQQQVYVFSIISDEPFAENLTPFYLANFEDENIELDDVLVNSSGLINEGNFDINPDGTITLRFPWIGVAFYGENRIITGLVDRNLSDLVRSQEVQLGGSTLSPGEIPNLIYNIEGGIGIFGSMSTDTVSTRILRP